MTRTERHPPPAPRTLRMSLERAVVDGRALLMRDDTVAVQATAEHRPARALHPRTVGASGAVMAQTLGVNAAEFAVREDFAPRWSASLYAIERMSVADWANAWRTLYGKTGTPALPRPDIEFERRMEAVVTDKWSATAGFTTKDTYQAWLAHCEREARLTLGPIENSLAAELEAVAAPSTPETLAGALRVALDDGRALARRARRGDTRYTFDSVHWHTGVNPWCDTCAVCAAGAVMARTLGCPELETTFPDRFAYPWERTLKAIDALRARRWRSAFDAMHGERHAGRKRFAQGMDSDAAAGRLRVERFRDLVGYETWLAHVETALLPAVAASEAQALSTT